MAIAKILQSDEAQANQLLGPDLDGIDDDVTGVTGVTGITGITGIIRSELALVAGALTIILVGRGEIGHDRACSRILVYGCVVERDVRRVLVEVVHREGDGL